MSLHEAWIDVPNLTADFPASFLTYTNPQTPLALQLEAVVRF